jgi:hypothetical protein
MDRGAAGVPTGSVHNARPYRRYRYRVSGRVARRFLARWRGAGDLGHLSPDHQACASEAQPYFSSSGRASAPTEALFIPMLTLCADGPMSALVRSCYALIV